MKTALKALISSVVLLSAPMLQAAPTGKLSFIQTAGEVGPTDSIPVWLRFTLDSDSSPLVLSNDSAATPPFGLNVADLPALGLLYMTASGGYAYEETTLSTISSARLDTWFGCSGNFTASCDPGAYRFDWNVGDDSLASIDYLSLQPGQSVDYLWGSFTPANGPVAAGDYVFIYAGLHLQLIGSALVTKYDVEGHAVPQLDSKGNIIHDQYGNTVYEKLQVDDASGNFLIAGTLCGNTYSSCPTSFRRTVSAVPVPAAMWLFGSGLLGLAITKRRSFQPA